MGGEAVVTAAGLAAAGAWVGYTLGAQAYFRGLGAGVLRHGPPGVPAVAFTFDDGPDPEATLAIAAALEAGNGRATFFMLGSRAARYPDIVRHLTDSGHELGVHGYTHRHLWTRGPVATGQELRRALHVLAALAGGKPPRWYRPPWGHFNASVVAWAARYGLKVVLWSAAPPDYRRDITPLQLTAAVSRHLRPGAILDLHDGGPQGRAAPLLAAIGDMVDAARARGLRCVTLSELFEEAGAW